VAVAVELPVVLFPVLVEGNALGAAVLEEPEPLSQ
jgi:hypothetical protein